MQVLAQMLDRLWLVEVIAKVFHGQIETKIFICRLPVFTRLKQAEVQLQARSMQLQHAALIRVRDRFAALRVQVFQPAQQILIQRYF